MKLYIFVEIHAIHHITIPSIKTDGKRIWTNFRACREKKIMRTHLAFFFLLLLEEDA